VSGLPGSLDTTFRHETPEGIELELRLAGPVVRGLAWTIDFGIRAVAYIALAIVVSLLGGLGQAISLIALFLVEWFYPVFFEMRTGATPGKKAMGIVVMQEDGSPLSWSSSLLRNLLRAADFLPVLYCTGFVSLMLNAKFQRLGDLAAATVVVYPALDESLSTIPDFPPKPLPFPLTLSEQRLILSFAERANTLSSERRTELAGSLRFLTEKSQQDPESALLSYANYLVHGR